ncbi:MAG: NUDIX hydrolase [Acidobacteriota bacterium]|nr:NUDIX hydrolase [Blastocatellia bacterium]MDW8411267.1 NUDIX hydrolase [Acidobacteriota bacterium]
MYPKPSVTADCAIFALVDSKVHILLIERNNEPFKGKWALPGGFVDINELIDTAAYRELKEETGLENVRLRRIGVYDAPGRDPRGRTITFLYLALIDKLPDIKAADDASSAKWFTLDSLPELAFDHAVLISDAKNKLYESISLVLAASDCFDETFTLGSLRKVRL